MHWTRFPSTIAVLLVLLSCGSAGGGPDGAADAEGSPDEEAPEAATPDCSSVPTFADGLLPLRELHVAPPPEGDDGSGDGSSGAPFASLARALEGIRPGDAVRLHPGTYAGTLSVQDVRGRVDAPIWIGGVPGLSKPRVQGGTESAHLTRVSHVVLHDLEVTAATHNGMNCDDGGAFDDAEATHNVVFRDLHVHDVGTGGNNDGLKLSGVNHYIVLDCVFERVDAGSGIDHVGCHHGLIARCRFEGMGSNAIQCKGGTEDVEIRRCSFVDAGLRGVNIGGSTGFAYFRPPLSPTAPNAEARNVRVVANVFANAQTPFAFVGAVDCLVANNTFQGDAYRWLFRVLQETTSTAEYEFLPTQGCRLSNNVFHFDRDALSTYVNVGSNTRGDTYVISHNLWYAAGSAPGSRPTDLPASETAGVYGQDPFPDTATAPRITAESPAAGAGTPLAAVPGDAEGRCYASPPSIGAFAAR